MELKYPLFLFSQNWKEIFSNERVRSLYTGNKSLCLCQGKLIK